MTFDLRIEFTGLIAFHAGKPPGADSSKSAKAGDSRATLDLESPRCVQALFVQGKKDAMRHTPLLAVDMRYFHGLAGSPLEAVTQLPGGTQVGIWGLKGRRLGIAAAGLQDADGVRMEYGPSFRSELPTAETERSLRWAPSLSSVTGKRDLAVKQRLLDGNINDDDPVAACFELDRGVLHTLVDAPGYWGRRAWSFDRDERTASQFLADTIRWEVRDIRARSLKVFASAFDGSKTEMLEVQPVDGRIELGVTNLPHSSSGMAMTGDRVEHFRHYYEILANPPVERPLPRLREGDSGLSLGRGVRLAPPNVVSGQGIAGAPCGPIVIPGDYDYPFQGTGGP